MADTNPFDVSPLTAALHDAVDAARASMTAAGFDVRGMVVVADAQHQAAPEYVRSAAAFPMNAWGEHADMLREGVEVFERARAATLDGRITPPSEN